MMSKKLHLQKVDLFKPSFPAWCLDSSNRKGKGLAIQRIQCRLLRQQRAAAPLEAALQGQQPLPDLLDATSGRIGPGAKQRQGSGLLVSCTFLPLKKDTKKEKTSHQNGGFRIDNTSLKLVKLINMTRGTEDVWEL